MAVANANGEGTSEPPRRLMEGIRPFIRDNLYAKTEGLGIVRDLVLDGKPRHNPLSFFDLSHF